LYKIYKLTEKFRNYAGNIKTTAVAKMPQRFLFVCE